MLKFEPQVCLIPAPLYSFKSMKRIEERDEKGEGSNKYMMQ